MYKISPRNRTQEIRAKKGAVGVESTHSVFESFTDSERKKVWGVGSFKGNRHGSFVQTGDESE